ncbi:MAG: hypothetical protein ABR924_21700 [Terracidiphilus sp.]|jgi:hypothetical protein
MKVLAVTALIFALIYNIVVKAAIFMFATFILVLATVGLYDLVILPFRKNRLGGRRAVA